MSPSPFLSNTHFHFFSARTPRWSFADNTTMASLRHHRRKDKVVVVMGATGTGKSRLSIDLAAHFPAEIINSDKIQVYRGLDITTNKISFSDRRFVPHHLLGDRHPHADFSASSFRLLAARSVASISDAMKLPLLVGGSNSFVHALVADKFDPLADVPISSSLRYRCCFIWVDLSFSVLADYLSTRVDDMLDSGMFEELAAFFSDSESESASRIGLRKAIGVPEFNKYFRKYPPARFGQARPAGCDPVRARAYEEAVREVKENTIQLAKRQMGKIQRLRDAGWDLNRIDATETFRQVLSPESEIWERQVVEQSVKIVRRFVEE